MNLGFHVNWSKNLALVSLLLGCAALAVGACSASGSVGGERPGNSQSDGGTGNASAAGSAGSGLVASAGQAAGGSGQTGGSSGNSSSNGGSASCPTGTLACSGACVSPANDNQHCGGCGTVCPAGSSCQAGACACASGQTACATGCASTATDLNHCGGCGTVCQSDALCQSGACVCATGRTACAGACIDVNADASNCGACGHACAANQVCSNGACASSCATGQTACNGACVDLSSNADHCGTCSGACLAGQTCGGGVCSCAAGQKACTGQCVNTSTDNANCGVCGTACTAGHACSGGACSCSGGQSDCSGSCKTLTSDPANCGKCGVACGTGQACTNGACSCASGQTSCSGSCKTLTTDPANCGACGTACGTGQTCSNGACTGGTSTSGTPCNFASGLDVAWVKFANDVPNPNLTTFNTIFANTHAAGGRVVRWWFHTNGTVTPGYDSSGKAKALQQSHIDGVKAILNAANSNGVAVNISLWSFDMLQSNAGTTHTNNQLLLENDSNRQAYIDNYLTPLVKALKGTPGLYSYEIFNEPEGMGPKGWATFRTTEAFIQKTVNWFADAIHAADPNVLVTNGAVTFDYCSSASGKTNFYTDSALRSVGGRQGGILNFYKVHYYTSNGASNSPFTHTAASWGLDKKLVMGEFAAQATDGTAQNDLYTKLYTGGYNGAWAWSYNQPGAGLAAWPSMQTAMQNVFNAHADVGTCP